MTDDVDPDELSDPNDLAGLKVVITGRLEHHKRGESRDLVKRARGHRHEVDLEAN